MDLEESSTKDLEPKAPRIKEVLKERKVLEKKVALSKKRKKDSRYVFIWPHSHYNSLSTSFQKRGIEDDSKESDLECVYYSMFMKYHGIGFFFSIIIHYINIYDISKQCVLLFFFCGGGSRLYLIISWNHWTLCPEQCKCISTQCP